ncbi:MAG: hypothetical protein HQL49_09460 [Gammaproteobacteria bacterium]|nr:hypothetical protein [Gammaproteobacteria bacterium]
MSRLLRIENLLLPQFAGDVPDVPINLELNKGEQLLLLGESRFLLQGIMDSIVGLAPLRSGRIVIAGEEMSSPERHIAPHLRHCALVPALGEECTLIPDLSLLENVALAAHPFSRHKRLQMAQYYLEQVGLTIQGESFPAEQPEEIQFWTLVARALTQEPELLLIEHPGERFSTADRQRIFATLQILIKESGLAALICSSDAQLLYHSPQIAIISERGIEQRGEASELYCTPKNYHVAQFCGPCQRIEGTFIANQIIQCEFARVRPELPYEMIGLPEKTTFLLRPHEVFYESRALSHATVSINQFAGALRHYSLTLGSGNRLEVTTPSEIDIAVGKRFPFRLQLRHLLISGEDGDFIDLGAAASV